MMQNMKTYTLITLLIIIGITIIIFARIQKKTSILPTWGIALNGAPITSDQLYDAAINTGQNPGIVVFFMPWPDRYSKSSSDFPDISLNAIDTINAIPCITWEPLYIKEGREIMISFDDILSGMHDEYIEAFAQSARSYKKPLLIRFAHEMNLSRYHWGSTAEEYGPETPSLYKKTFRYLVSKFREAHADNALWVFCPNAESIPNKLMRAEASWNSVENYYPGNEFVDIIGMDGYNWGTSQQYTVNGWNSSWKSFEEIFFSVYNTLKTIAPDKPLAIFEMASVTEDGNKKEWIVDALKKAREWNIQGVTWFQANKETHWAFDGTSPEIQKHIRDNTSCDTSWITGIYDEKSRASKAP